MHNHRAGNVSDLSIIQIPLSIVRRFSVRVVTRPPNNDFILGTLLHYQNGRR